MELKSNWSFPTAIRFGAGRVSELPEACRSAGIRKPLFVTDRVLNRLECVATVRGILSDAGLEHGAFAEVDPNPSDRNLEAGLATYFSGGFDGVVAMGGGSAIDLGKVVAFMSGQTRPVWDFEDVGDWWKRASVVDIAPSIAIPTTAGTGSEVGRASVITNSHTKVKKIIFHPRVLPVEVIADPELTLGMPPAITAGTGMDALAHCIEAYSSPFYHPMCQGIALEGMRLALAFLPRAFRDGSDIEARANMMSAAAMGAVAFQKGLGAVHALSHPVGALFDAHHGTTNAVVLPHILAFNRPVIEDRIVAASAYVGVHGGFDGFLDHISGLCRSLAIPESLSAFGVEEDSIPELARMALSDPTAGGNPRRLNLENLSDLYARCL